MPFHGPAGRATPMTGLSVKRKSCCRARSDHAGNLLAAGAISADAGAALVTHVSDVRPGRFIRSSLSSSRASRIVEKVVEEHEPAHVAGM
eukprot:212628-Pleurochrysis_carterae.AAC.1